MAFIYFINIIYENLLSFFVTSGPAATGSLRVLRADALFLVARRDFLVGAPAVNRRFART